MLISLNNNLFLTEKIVYISGITHHTNPAFKFVIHFQGDFSYDIVIGHERTDLSYKNVEAQIYELRLKIAELWSNPLYIKSNYTKDDGIIIFNY
jgi:hypothetical protein